MQDDLIGRCLRALRHRLGRTQTEAADRAGIARSLLSELEAGRIGAHSVDALRAAARSMGASLRIDLILPGGDVGRLLDADHAALQQRLVTWLQRFAWTVEVEVTFSRYGERGSIDILAWHPATRILVMIELKTVIVDVQALLATLDRNTRNARFIAGERGWQPRVIVPVLVILEGRTARRRFAEHEALFARLALRGRAALRWLRDPATAVAPSGIVVFTKLSSVRSGDRRRAGRQRIRPDGRQARSAERHTAA